tara:strand:+ start:6632 stop:7552 length:921 start_codon:yes stop_codon:yes gene_type:complete
MSKEELNNSEFEIQARVQKVFVDATAKKVENHEALNDSEIKLLCPVAMKTTMGNDEIAKLGLSEHYSFVPTINVVNDLRELGYEVVDAVQVKSRKKSTNGYQKHMLTLEHPKYKIEGSEEYPQILLTNSHDGGNAFSLSAGIFRLVCSNGLVIKTEDYGTARLVHKGYSFEAVQELVKQFEEQMSEVLTKITAMKKVELTKAQQIEFAKKAALLRFTAKSYNEDNISDVVNIDDLLNVDRKEDAGNGLYEVFNRVQESIVQGKYLYASNGKVKDANTKTRKARPIKNFKQSIEVNKKLSELAFELV